MNYNKAEFYTSFGKFSQIPKSDRLEFAFSGRSNVGKSSLINKLLNRKNLARVSSMPGKTVTINFFSVENMDDTPSINLILGMLGYLLIMPIIMGVTRPSIPSKKWDVKEKSKGKLILLFYISFAAVLLVAVMAGVAIFAMN